MLVAKFSVKFRSWINTRRKCTRTVEASFKIDFRCISLRVKIIGEVEKKNCEQNKIYYNQDLELRFLLLFIKILFPSFFSKMKTRVKEEDSFRAQFVEKSLLDVSIYIHTYIYLDKCNVFSVQYNL